MALFFRFVVGKMSNFVGTLAIVFSYSLSIWLVAAAAAAAAENNSSHIQMESFAKKERCGTKQLCTMYDLANLCPHFFTHYYLWCVFARHGILGENKRFSSHWQLMDEWGNSRKKNLFFLKIIMQPLLHSISNSLSLLFQLMM